MPNIRFYINKGSKDKDGLVTILAKMTLNYKSYYKKIDKILLRHWNLKQQRVRPNRESESYNRFKEINSTIDQLESNVKDFNNYCNLSKETFTEKHIQELLNGQKIDKLSNVDFKQAFQEFIDNGKNTKAYNTTRNITTIFNYLVAFQKETNYNISLNSIDLQFFDLLVDYSYNSKKIRNNYFAKIIAVLKSFLIWAADRNYYSGNEHLKFKAAEKDITPITLTVDEFKTLYNFNFKSKKHQKVRDIFCFGCLTGLRYSDLQQLRREHIQEDCILKTTQKIKEPVKIPLVNFSRKIIERYQEQPIYVLPRMSNQKFNEYLKIICEDVKLKRPIVIDNFKGNKFTQEAKLLYDVMTAHVARKTFITLSVFMGMKIKVVQEITGITQEKTLRKYLTIADEMKKNEMEDTWGKL
ncbi:MAG: integrase catalytic domain-containing protein [Mariniphaga sp.]|nr:integrase catalytic domain-containing protein [Mariniphaga sp.]